MHTATTMFMDALEKWLAAAKAGNFVEARRHAQNLISHGELLTIHPEFIKAFHSHCEGVEPKEALVHLCQFLVSATDGHAMVLKQYLEDKVRELI